MLETPVDIIPMLKFVTGLAVVTILTTTLFGMVIKKLFQIMKG